MGTNLGRRVRFFRNRAGLSQLALEAETGSASGVISRIENNQVNPTKETIFKISNVLHLSNHEVDYLIGETAEPATIKEIEEAKQIAQEILENQPKLTYLIDIRWRYWMISRAFIELLHLTPEEINYIIGKTTVEIVVMEDSPILKRINKRFYKSLLEMYLPSYYNDMSYMDDDVIYQRTIKEINKNQTAKKVWGSIQNINNQTVLTQGERVVHFNLFGIKFPLYYAFQYLPSNRKFYIVEFVTANKILKFLPLKLI